MWRDAYEPSDPRDRDLVRRDRRGADHAPRRDPCQRRRVAGGAARRLRRCRARDRVAPASRAHLAGDRRSARHGRRVARRRRHRGGHSRPGPDRRAARRALGRQGDRVGARAAARARQPPARPRRLALSRSRSTWSRPSPACSRAAATRCCSTSRAASLGEVARARHDARRRRRRGLRQGRAAARAAVSRRGRDRPPRARGRPGGLRASRRPRAGARLLVLRAEDGAALCRRAILHPPSSSGGGPISPRATSARSCARSSSGSRRRARDRRRDRGRRRRELGAARGAARMRSLRRSRSAPTTRR